MTKLRALILVSMVGCLAGLLPDTPVQRFLTALVGAALPLTVYGIALLGRAAFNNLRNRNWLQFSLRGLLASIAICAVGLAIWDRWLGPAREQRQFIAAVLDLKGAVYVEEDGTMRVSLPDTTDEVLAALASLPGRRTVSTLGFARCQITNDGLIHLLKFPELTGVYFDQCPITDQGVDVLVDIPKLNSISAGKCLITDEGIRKFRVLPRIHVLSFTDCPITDEGVCWLAARRELKAIGFKNTNITPEKMAELKRALPFSQVNYQ